jgi:hypothetical protein
VPDDSSNGRYRWPGEQAVSDSDPWAVLGLAPDASVGEARAARRRLAKVLHPDLHAGEPAADQAELAARMTVVNGALAQIEAAADAAAAAASAAAAGARPRSGWERAPGSRGTATRSGAARDRAGPRTRRGGGPAGPGGEEPSPSGPPAAGDGVGDARHAASATGPSDPDSFSVGALPVEAFEALFVVAYGLGEILVADEPYLLELYLTEPSPCFCRLTLVPEAGASLVTVEVSPAAETTSAPEPAAVVEVLVAELNALVAR